MSKVLKALKGDSIEAIMSEKEHGEACVIETVVESVSEKENGHWVYSFYDDEDQLKTSENVKLI